MKNRKLKLFQAKPDANYLPVNVDGQKKEPIQKKCEKSYRDIFLVNDRSKNRVSANISRELYNSETEKPL